MKSDKKAALSKDALGKEPEEALKQLVARIFADDDWDYRHTLSAAKWMKHIVKHEGGDERVLVTAMYLHDIGYAGALKNGYSLDDRIEAKTHHMARGAEQARGLLPKLGFSDSEVEKITYLISVHDRIEELRTRDELLVLEADSLAQIDPVTGNTFGEEEFARYVEIFERKRAPRFITKTGKAALKKLARENKLFQKYAVLLKK